MTPAQLADRAVIAARASGAPELVITLAVLLTAATLAAIEWLVVRGLDWLFPPNGEAPGPVRRLALRTVVISPEIARAAKAQGVTLTAAEHRTLVERMEAGIVTAVCGLTSEERAELKAGVRR